MVEVKKEGKREANCKRCGSTLTYEKSDVYHYSDVALTGYKIKCPVCGTEVTVGNPDLWMNRFF
jgi:endogenous inhibitor of DNA gyrase (YacG/DUF329 family)